MAKKKIMCAAGIHCDAVAGWLGSYGGENSPCDISRGVFGAEVGMPRMIELLRRLDLKATWFIPGHTIESFPKQTEAVAAAGHEIGLHGYSHENPLNLSRKQEQAILNKCIGLIEKFWGRPPVGYVAPWWEVSETSVELLLEAGIKYDNSLMHDDHTPYYVRVGDSYTKIDYSQPAEYWMKPFVYGSKVTKLVELPASWYLDDLPPMLFIKANANSHGFVNPRDIESLWKDQFDWIYREMDYAVYLLTLHPDVSGRPQNLLMLERLIDYIRKHDGVEWTTFEAVADDFAQRHPQK
jgi:peptidoglycan/xylan/chitin deacetylase (PgdA/CDA1 family)